MRKIINELKNRTINYDKLLEYGFINNNDIYIYKNKICDDQFEMIVEIKKDDFTSKLIDLANEDEYILVDIQDAVGEFVGNVRNEYEKYLQEIINKCSTSNVFKEKQTHEIIKYIKDKYNDDLEFLWEKFEDTAIWRNKQNNKWYGLLMVISNRKLGIDSDEKVEAIDLRYQKGKTSQIIDNENIFPGYHMNKNSWITIKLNNSMSTADVCNLIDNSYNLSMGNKKI